MGMLDELTKNLGPGAQGRVVGGQGAVAQAVLGLLAGGGLQRLISSFQQNGMGDIIGSWISTSANEPVSPQQIGQAFGPEQLSQLSQQTGVDSGALANQLSHLLPGLVDKLTPDGNVPDAGALQDRLGGLLKGFF